MPYRSNTDDFLEHFGIKGMKWGRRKAESPSLSGEALKNEVKELNLKKQHRDLTAKPAKTSAPTGPWRAPVKSLSDKELQLRVSRLNMEKQYKELTKRDLTPTEKAVRNLAMTFATAAANKAGEAAMNWATGRSSSGKTSNAYSTAMVVRQVMAPMLLKAITKG